MKQALIRVATSAVLLTLATGFTPADYRAQFLEYTKAWGSAVADYNGDGHDDIFVTGHDTDDRIWYWTPQGYVPSSQTLPPVDRHDCDAADVNRDGRMDFFCAIGAERGKGLGPNELWLQQPDGTFRAAANHGAEDPWGSSRRPIFLDVNHDGWPDLYVTNEWQTRTDGHVSINRLYINQGGTRFQEVETIATGNKGWACVDKADIDGDGFDDLVTCDPSGAPHIFINNRASNFSETYPVARDKTWQWAQLRDLNRDGRPDLITLSNGNDLQVWLNSGSGRYFDRAYFSSHLSEPGKSLTVGDFNRDGWPDIYVAQADDHCKKKLVDQADDVVFWGRPDGLWNKGQLTQGYEGCGHEVATVDEDKVLLTNGGSKHRGPNYVLSW